MKEYYMAEDEEIGAAITRTLEQQAGKEIFTMRTFDHEHAANTLEAIVIFTDKSVLMGTIQPYKIKGNWAARIRANFI